VMVQPINVIFRHLQNRTKTSFWISDGNRLKIEGVVVGFDEYMNIVLDKAEEVFLEKGNEVRRKYIGRILMKGDSITLMHPLKDTETLAVGATA